MKLSAVMTRFDVGLAFAAGEVGIQGRTTKLINPDARHQGARWRQCR